MKDSTKRALRTAYQVVVALIVVAPLLATVLADTPMAAQIGTFAAAVAVVSKVVNALEERGVIPAWLKGDETL